MNPHKVTLSFERAVAAYTNAPYCVAVNSCTNALFLCLKWHKQTEDIYRSNGAIEIPKHTYLSVPMQIIHAGYKVTFRDEQWYGTYQLEPLNIWDSARWFTSGMYKQEFGPGSFVCTSHHWSKTLGIQQGGCILHDNEEADKWLRRARFDGRAEGKSPKEDNPTLGWHMYMSPEVAAEGLVRLHFLPKHNKPMPNDDYPDLSKLDIFR